MATTNFTITGYNFNINDPWGGFVDTVPVALVQWDVGYNPAVRPLNEWVMNPVNVSWTGWYVKDYANVGQGVFGSNGTAVNFTSPIYLFIDLSQASNFTTSMSGQVWMGQITDSLVLNGQNQTIDLNAANIRAVVGSINGNTMTSQDFNTWTPTAIPEPSYAPLAVVLFAVAVFWKKLTKPQKEAQ